MTERPDAISRVAELRAQTQKASAQFLLTELRSGIALLDLADETEDSAARQRRATLAQSAYDVVTDHLARTGDAGVSLSDGDLAEITRLHTELGRRLGRSGP